ncbi:MAG: M20/M25/M40 family metallo-hydrolase, partial [Candidatus Kapaibacteriales bacterium]
PIFFLVLFNALGFDGTSNIDLIITNIKRIADKIGKSRVGWDRLAILCDDFGPRLSGSENLNNAINWIEEKLREDGFDSVWTEDVYVPKWVRVHEECELVYPRKKRIPLITLGGSVSTPPEGITAEVLVVRNFDELTAKKNEAKGKIILYTPPYESYGKTVQYRWLGASRAAEVGAIAALIRPVTPLSMNNPHTGSMHYIDTLPKIPIASITEEDALLLERFQNRGIRPKIYLKIETRNDEKVLSKNVIAEIRGIRHNEIIDFGGHIDSWDVGSGAQDDAGGCMASWEALRVFKSLNIKPNRTLRLVFWVNEEFGLDGGRSYAENHKNEDHKLLFEFDSGVFPPTKIGFLGPDSLWNKVKGLENLIKTVLPEIEIYRGGGGVDISPMTKLGFPGGSLLTNDGGKYFWYHHSETDTPDKVNPKDLNDCAIAIAVFLYLYSDLI